MPGRAKSEVVKCYAHLEAVRNNETRAVEAYNREMEEYVAGSGVKPSYRGVAARFGLDCWLLQC